jgi:hypothetical protein
MSKKTTATTAKAKKRVSTAVFVPAYLKAVATGMTREDLAAQLGIEPSSIYQRVYDMYQKGACQKTFPHLPTTGKQSYLDRIQAAVDDYRKGSGQAAIVAAVTKQVGKKGKPPAEKTVTVGDDDDLDATAALERLLNG